MAYFHEKSDGTVKVYPHRGNKFLANKISDLLRIYSPDQVLSEIAYQRSGFDICVRVPGLQSLPSNASAVAAMAGNEGD